MPTLGNTPRPAYVYDTETDTWVPVGVGAHTHSDIPNTLVDAKGDLITATADNVPARLAKGSDGTVLVADSSTSTGLAWQPYAAQNVAGKNAIINGGMDIWQRGTSSGSNGTGGYFAADRWYIVSSGTATHSRDTDVPSNAGVQYSQKILTGASSSYGQAYQLIEQDTVRSLRGQTVTLSAYFKTAGSYSGGLIMSAEYSTTTDIWTNTWIGVTSGSINFTGSSVTSWTRKSFTFVVPSNAVGIRLAYVPDTVQSSGVSVWHTGWQLEQGSIATPFSRAGGTIQGELAACQRYYWRTSRESQGSSSRITPYGIAQSTTAAEINFYLPTAMRTKPSSIDFANLRTYDGATLQVVTSVGIGDGSSTSINLGFTVASGLVQYRPTAAALNGDGYLGLSAEL
jgi:hypothetical protein